MIECEGDDEGMRKKCLQLAKELLSETGSRSVQDLSIIAEMKEGYFIASARLRRGPSSMDLVDCGNLEERGDRIVLHIDPSMEPHLPAILTELRERYGKESVKEVTRYEVSIRTEDKESLMKLTIGRQPDAMDTVVPLLNLLAPEGFKISRTLTGRKAFTIMKSQYPIKDHWKKRMERAHMKLEKGG